MSVTLNATANIKTSARANRATAVAPPARSSHAGWRAAGIAPSLVRAGTSLAARKYSTIAQNDTQKNNRCRLSLIPSAPRRDTSGNRQKKNVPAIAAAAPISRRIKR